MIKETGCVQQFLMVNAVGFIGRQFSSDVGVWLNWELQEEQHKERLQQVWMYTSLLVANEFI